MSLDMPQRSREFSLTLAGLNKQMENGCYHRMQIVGMMGHPIAIALDDSPFSKGCYVRVATETSELPVIRHM